MPDSPGFRISITTEGISISHTGVLKEYDISHIIEALAFSVYTHRKIQGCGFLTIPKGIQNIVKDLIT